MVKGTPRTEFEFNGGNLVMRTDSYNFFVNYKTAKGTNFQDTTKWIVLPLDDDLGDFDFSGGALLISRAGVTKVLSVFDNTASKLNAMQGILTSITTLLNQGYAKGTVNITLNNQY